MGHQLCTPGITVKGLTQWHKEIESLFSVLDFRRLFQELSFENKQWKNSSSKKCHCGDTVLDFMLIFWVKFRVVTPLQGGST